MNKTSILNKAEDAIHLAQQSKAKRNLIYSGNEVKGKHEFLFFVKPEITLKSETIQRKAILEMLLQKMVDFDLTIKNVILLPAEYLKENAIIAQHYGVINSLARDINNKLSSNAKDKFAEEFGVPFSSARVYGGLEFISAYPALSPAGLDYLWQNSPTVKLGGGAYAQSLKIDGEQVYLVNGFHPRQLEHFIMPGRSILAFTLCGDLDWSRARNEFIGKTNPAEAVEGSIRRTLLDNKTTYGLQAVNSSWNGVHLSAGPIEGLVELIRYNTDFSSSERLEPSSFSFGSELVNTFKPEITEKILQNINVDYKGQSESIFDITEEKNADEAIGILKEVFA